MSGLGSIFQYEGKKSMLAEEPEEYALAYIEATYEDPGEKAPMVFMDRGG